MDVTSMDATNMDVLLKDAPNHRGTERRGYGSSENGTELDALYRALRGERESCSVCALPVMTD